MCLTFVKVLNTEKYILRAFIFFLVERFLILLRGLDLKGRLGIVAWRGREYLVYLKMCKNTWCT